MTHDQALARALLAVTRAGGRAFRHEVGLFRDPTGRTHLIGTKGEPDLMGLTADGRALAVEVKVGRDVLRPAQAAFARVWTALGGLHIEPRYGAGVDGDATIAAALVHSRDKVPSR